jgi:hypothetical protein
VSSASFIYSNADSHVKEWTGIKMINLVKIKYAANEENLIELGK